MVKLWGSIATAMIVTALASNLIVAEDAPGGGRPRGGYGGRPSFDTLLGAFDGHESGDLAEEEVPSRVWGRLSRADADDNGVVTREEFESVAKPRGFGGPPSYDELLDAFDGDGSDDLTEDEVPPLPWTMFSPIVDADGDGVVTREEFESVAKPRGI